MKRIFRASFVDVENIINQEEIDEIYKGKAYRLTGNDVIKMLSICLLALIPLYFLYFLNWMLVEGIRDTPEELSIPVDQTNEYITMLDNFYFVHWIALLFIMMTLVVLFIRNKNFLFSALTFNSGTALYISLFYVRV